ncbi:MAG: pyridoxal 5'-phosphate synthase [Cellvibrionaceae bacterium]
MLGDATYKEVISQLNSYLNEAKTFGNLNANCCFMATVSRENQPSVRIITVYEINEKGLSFLAKKESGKIIHLKQNPKAAMCFHWDAINVQVTIEGIVEELNQKKSAEIWKKRDHDAKISAWAADIAKNNDDKNNIKVYTSEAKQRFQEQQPPLATSWCGYILKPTRIEFWPSVWKKNKKHTCYSKQGGYWHESSYY